MLTLEHILYVDVTILELESHAHILMYESRSSIKQNLPNIPFIKSLISINKKYIVSNDNSCKIIYIYIAFKNSLQIT